MFAVAVSTALSSRLSRDTIYTLKLRRRGVEILASGTASVITGLKVSDAMQPAAAAVCESLLLTDLAVRLDASGVDALPVIDADGRYRGTVTVRAVSGALRDGRFGATAGDLAERPPTLDARQTLLQALDVLAAQEQSGVPVVDEAGSVDGWVSQKNVLALLSERLNRDVARARESGGRRPRPRSASPPPARARVTPPEGYRGIDLELSAQAAVIGSRLSDVTLPPGALVVALVRDGQPSPPGQDMVLQKGDRLTILAPDELREATLDAFADPGRREATAGADDTGTA